MRIMLEATYERQPKYAPDAEPKLIDCKYGEVPDEVVLGAAAMTMVDAARMQGHSELAERITAAAEAAAREGTIVLPGRERK